MRLRGAGTRVNEIVLSALELDDVCRLIASAVHGDEQHVRPLARLVAEKTGGNPFFTIQFLTELAAESLLSFDAGTAAWNWNVARIGAKGYTDNIAQLMVAKLQRLPAAAQEALKELACLGNIADVATLAVVRESSEEEIHSAFRDAAQAGLVIRLEGAYRFAHDRVQEAAYALIPQALRPEVHLRIGRQLRAASDKEPTAERVFAVVNQLNHAVDLIADADEKMALLRLNVLAGMKAKAGIAYGAARDYLAHAAALVAADAWTRCYDETLDLYLGLAECEYLVGHFDSADQLFELMLGKARSDLDRARIYSLRIKVYQAGSRYDESVVLALEALQLFGVTFPESDDEIQATADAEFRAVTANLGGRRIGDLLDAPAAECPRGAGHHRSAGRCGARRIQREAEALSAGDHEGGERRWHRSGNLDRVSAMASATSRLVRARDADTPERSAPDGLASPARRHACLFGLVRSSAQRFSASRTACARWNPDVLHVLGNRLVRVQTKRLLPELGEGFETDF